MIELFIRGTQMNKDNIEDFLKEEYGISNELISEEEKNQWLKEHGDSIVKLNAGLRDIPNWILEQKNKQKYSDVYRVIYDKGIGQLQQSAKNKDLLRANIVEYGTNNHVVGQAELQAVSIDKFTELSDATLSVFRMASVATNQYFLYRIDNKLSSIEKKTNEIKRFLELDKESELLANYEYVSKSINNIEFITEDDAYRLAVLSKVQDIKVKSLQNIRFYKEKLNDINGNLNVGDNKSETMEKMQKLREQFSELWLSVNLYALSSYLEIRLSEITDKKYLDKTVDDVLDKILDYKDVYKKHYDDLQNYVKDLKRLKPNQIIPILRSLSWLIDLSGQWYSDLARQAAQKGTDVLAEKDKHDKGEEEKKTLNMLKDYLAPYSDIETLEESVKEIMYLEILYSEKVEIVSDNENAYLFTPDADLKVNSKLHQIKTDLQMEKE